MTRPLIEPTDEASELKLTAFSNQLSDAETDAVSKILQGSEPDRAALAVIENAAGFAERMTRKVRHPDSPPVACKKGCSWCCHTAAPCAEFTSYDVEVCKRGYDSGFKMGSVIHEKARMVVFHAVQRGLFAGLRNSLPKADTSVLELTAAVLDAIAVPSGATEWFQGAPLFASAHLATEPEDAA